MQNFDLISKVKEKDKFISKWKLIRQYQTDNKLLNQKCMDFAGSMRTKCVGQMVWAFLSCQLLRVWMEPKLWVNWVVRFLAPQRKIESYSVGIRKKFTQATLFTLDSNVMILHTLESITWKTNLSKKNNLHWRRIT